MRRFAHGWFPTLFGVVAMGMATIADVYAHPEPAPVDFERAPAIR